MTAPGRFCCCGTGADPVPPSGSDCDEIATFCDHPSSIVLEWEFAMKFNTETLGGTVTQRWDISWTVQAVADTGQWGNYDVTDWSGPIFCRNENVSSGAVRLIDSDFSTPAVAGVAGDGAGVESCRLDAFCSENADPLLFDRNWGVGLRDLSATPNSGTPPQFNRTLNGSPDGTTQPFMAVVINLGSEVEVVEKSLTCALPDSFTFDRDQTYIDFAAGTPTGTPRQVSDWEDGVGSFRIDIETFTNIIRRVP